MDKSTLVRVRGGVTTIFTYQVGVSSQVSSQPISLVSLAYLIPRINNTNNSLHIMGINWTHTWPASNEASLALLVEHHTGITDIMDSNPVGASEFFMGFICNCVTS